NGRLRPVVAQLLGEAPAHYTARQMGYDLRRLARKGLVRRVPGKLCYTLTPFGRRVALFLTKVHARVLRPGLQALDERLTTHVPPPLRGAFTALDAATDALIHEARLAAQDLEHLRADCSPTRLLEPRTGSACGGPIWR